MTVMDYNQLKLMILELFRESEEYESGQVLSLVVSKDSRHRDKAIEMALLRYWRQGLLRRERRHGRFFYALTERGLARRGWLRKTMASSEA
jgi:DNA-binding transcriptional regulator PaaX